MTNEMKKMAAVFTLVMLALSAAFGYVLWSMHSEHLTKVAALEKKIDLVAQHAAKAPKIVALDIAKAAREWAGQNDEIAIKAVESTIKYYNENGYLILDTSSTLGDISKYRGQVPTPEKMRKLMGDNEKKK